MYNFTGYLLKQQNYRRKLASTLTIRVGRQAV